MAMHKAALASVVACQQLEASRDRHRGHPTLRVFMPCRSAGEDMLQAGEWSNLRFASRRSVASADKTDRGLEVGGRESIAASAGASHAAGLRMQTRSGDGRVAATMTCPLRASHAGAGRSLRAGVCAGRVEGIPAHHRLQGLDPWSCRSCGAAELLKCLARGRGTKAKWWCPAIWRQPATTTPPPCCKRPPPQPWEFAARMQARP